MASSARFSEAFAYAAQLHAAQRRKGSDTPYVAHLLAVTATVLEHGGGEDEAIAALLHDAVEDQGGEPIRGEILRRFGPRVAEIVAGCTDADTIPKPPWRARKEAYLAQLFAADPAVHLVAAADKLHNARSILLDYRTLGESLWDRFSGGREGTLWYYREVADILSRARPGALTDELRRTVDALQQLVDAAGSR